MSMPRNARPRRATDTPPAISHLNWPDRGFARVPPRSDIAHDLAVLARRVAPRSRRAPSVEVDISAGRRGRVVVSTMTVNGKRIVVQKRRAFAVFVGEGPMKKR